MHMNVRNPAIRAYMARFTVSMVLYMVVLFGVVWVFNTHPPQGPASYLLAALPGLPIVGVIWSIGRYLLEEQDEYQKVRAVRSILGGIAVTLALTTVWGFIENFAGGPQIPMYYVFVVFCAAMGVIRCIP